MKLDNEQMLGHSNIGFKSDSKPFSFIADTKPLENREKPLDSTGLNAEGIVKENQNGIMHDIKDNREKPLDSTGLNAEGVVKENQNGIMHDIKDNDGDSDHLYLQNTIVEWPASKLDSSMNVNDFANGNEKVFSDFVASNSHPSKKMDSLQGSVFYLDKSVMECELPELVVCYKESTYHVVKDICIDEGVPTQDKFLFESDMDEKGDGNFLTSKKDQDCKPEKEKLQSNIRMQDVSLSSEDHQFCKDIDNECGSNKKLDSDTCRQDECNKEISNQCDSEDFMVTKEVKDEEKIITDDVSKELFTLGELLSMPELSTVNIKDMLSDRKSDGIDQQSSQGSSDKEVTVTPPSVSTAEESKITSDEGKLSSLALISAAGESDGGKGDAILINPPQVSASEEATNSSLANEVSDDSRPETESITFNFDSSAPTNRKDERRHNLGGEPTDTGSTLKLEDTANQPISDSFRYGTGESSFSAFGPVTGLISYSGPIAYSGSLSLRSDSSTTSTRSFAFPILQSEWNSSPVRMAKADRRHYRKHRGWRHGILCCRF